MIVFWAADPESTSGSYGAQEGTVRRQWLKNPKLGIKVVHIDPYYNASAQFLPGKWFAPKPTTSPAMAMAIAYVWIKEGLYDKEYVKTHTVGFDVWKAYLLGEEDGIAENAGVAGEGNRRSGQGRARARPRVGQEARLSRARRLGQRPRRRLPQPDRHPVGARHGVPRRRCRGSASPASTWAICNGAARSTSISISPATPTAACRAIWKTPRCRSSSTSACRNCRP